MSSLTAYLVRRLSLALPTLLGHYDPLRRAFGNIMRNAVEACDAQGEIEIAARAVGDEVSRYIRECAVMGHSVRQAQAVLKATGA